jgi:hypothetical protein
VSTQLTPEEQAKKLEELKGTRDRLIREAEQAAYAYFAECEVGNERIFAHTVYERVRHATYRGPL